MRDFKRLEVWKKAHELTLTVYQVTQNFPNTELYGMTSQVRRAASSIPANIAEGCGRDGEADFARFLHIALGSASELEYHILLAHDLGYLPVEPYACLEKQVVEVKRMLAGFLKRLRESNSKGSIS
jgi:four helix bundle protein